MCNPLETGVMFSFSATAPQLDSLTQRVNEVGRQNSNANGHFIEDSQDSPGFELKLSRRRFVNRDFVLDTPCKIS